MSGIEAAREFDEIAPVYDATRDPLDAATLEGFRATLVGETTGRLLEIGVGTGRVAGPLGDHGLEVVGLDASRGMLARARGKGLARLVRGNAYRLPLRDACVEAAYFVHVLHVLDDPVTALREAARVARRQVLALVGDRSAESAFAGPNATGADDPREVLRRIFHAEGIEPPSFNRPGKRERTLLERLPPDRRAAVSERVIDEPFSARLDRMEARAHRPTNRLPPEQLHRVIALAREQVGDRRVRHRIAYSVAFWDAERLRNGSRLPTSTDGAG